MTALADSAAIAAIAGAVGAVVAALAAGLLVHRRTKAETADIITQAAERLLTRYETHVAELESRLVQVEDEWRSCKALRREDRLLIEQMTVQIDELRRQVRRLSEGEE